MPSGVGAQHFSSTLQVEQKAAVGIHTLVLKLLAHDGKETRHGTPTALGTLRVGTRLGTNFTADPESADSRLADRLDPAVGGLLGSAYLLGLQTGELAR